MIKLFEEYRKLGPYKSKYKIGDRVYYHGMHRQVHDYYTISDIYYEEKIHTYRYDLRGKITLYGAWEKSLSEEDEEYKKRIEQFKEIDPYGEEDWDEN